MRRGILAVLLFAVSAGGADRFYLGVWKVESAAVAPWAEPGAKPDRTLAGKTVTLAPAAIEGPGILACKGPKYRVVEIPAEGLFQGAFDEMRRRGATQDPVQLAARVGLQGKSWKSLQTGCANEIDFHFADARTALIGLNDVVYTLKKQ